MPTFDDIYAKVRAQFASEQALEAVLPRAVTAATLKKRSDAYYLSMMSRRVFRAGLQHKMVDAKWPRFEVVFNGFEPLPITHYSDEKLEKAMQQEGIIAHWGKIKSIRHNAQFIQQMSQAHNGFGRWLAEWPNDDCVGLWKTLKTKAAHMGGQSGPAFLRMVGKDTFLLTDDVVAALRGMGVVERKPSTQAELALVQEQFVEWAKQSDRALCEVSRIVSYLADRYRRNMT